MSALDVLREASAWLGVAGGGVATEVFRRFRSAEKSAKIALKRSAEALASNEELKKRVDKLAEAFEALRQGLRMELTNFEKDIEDRLRNYTRGSRPDQFFDERRIEDLIAKIDEVRSDVLRERGQRHALQKDIQDYNKSEAESWRELERTLGRIESTIESYEKQIEQIRHEISTIRR